MSAGNLGGEHVLTAEPEGLRDSDERVRSAVLRPNPRYTGASELMSRAYAFAREAHAGQRQEADGSLYIDHAVAVGQLLYLAGCSEEVVAAGLLHDTVEDTDIRIVDIERNFGPEVARLVAATTEPADVHPFALRKEALRRQVAEAGYEAETIFAADKIVGTQTLRRAIAEQGEAQVRQRLAHPLDQKVEHYRDTLGLLDDVAESLPLLPLLREELAELSREHRWQVRLETINRLVEGFNRRGVDAVLELCDPQVLWAPAFTTEGRSPPYRGHEGIRRYFADLALRWSAARAVVYRLTRRGDNVLAVCGVLAQPRAGGPDLREQVAVAFSFRNGLVASARSYTDLSVARQATGDRGD
jgi:ketosteroid isomerase-like protein